MPVGEIKLRSLNCCLYRIGIRNAWGRAGRRALSISAKKQHLYTILKKIISFSIIVLPGKSEKMR